jgi:hypothetical protein
MTFYKKFTYNRQGSDIYPAVDFILKDVKLYVICIETLVHEEYVLRLRDLCIIYCSPLIVPPCSCHFKQNTVRSEGRCTLQVRYGDLVVGIEVSVEVCCCFNIQYSVQLKCNTGKVCNCLIKIYSLCFFPSRNVFFFLNKFLGKAIDTPI